MTIEYIRHTHLCLSILSKDKHLLVFRLVLSVCCVCVRVKCVRLLLWIFTAFNKTESDVRFPLLDNFRRSCKTIALLTSLVFVRSLEWLEFERTKQNRTAMTFLDSSTKIRTKKRKPFTATTRTLWRKVEGKKPPHTGNHPYPTSARTRRLG